MAVKNLCVANVVTCAQGISVAQAAQLMRERQVGDLVVVDDPMRADRIPLGMITDRDIAIEVVACGLDPTTTPVATVMRKPLVTAYESEEGSVVIERMRRHGVRRIPVIANEGEVVGIVSLEDLLRALVSNASSLLDAMARGRLNERQQLKSTD